MVHSSHLQSRYREVRNQKTEYDSFMCVLLSNGRRPFYLWLFSLRVSLNIEAVVIFRPTDGWNSFYRHFSYSYHRVSIRSICCEENSNQITFLPRWEFHFGVWGGDVGSISQAIESGTEYLIFQTECVSTLRSCPLQLWILSFSEPRSFIWCSVHLIFWKSWLFTTASFSCGYRKKETGGILWCLQGNWI